MKKHKVFFPDYEYESAFTLPYEKWYEQGVRGIIYDIDNTLALHGGPAQENAVSLFDRLHALGFRTVLLSNNKEPRVKSFAEAVSSDYIYKAGKPSVKGYRSAMEIMNTSESTTLFVGDQIFTDIWGANRAGIRSVLTKPIDKHEEIQIVLKRIPERLILFIYHIVNRKKETA